LKERATASDLDEDIMRITLPNFWVLPCHDFSEFSDHSESNCSYYKPIQLFKLKDQLPRRKFATRNYRSEVLIGFEMFICRASYPPNWNNMMSFWHLL